MDRVDKATRSGIMPRICGAGTGPEREAARLLGAETRGLRANARDLPGSPDLVDDAARVAVFVHGCFWHGCPKHYRAPRSNESFWSGKLVGNVRRDRRAARRLRRMGWSVITAWECALAAGTARAARSMDRRRGAGPGC